MEQSVKKKSVSFGTKEWAIHSVNCCTGCAHDCRYCYAKSMAIRFRRVSPGEWKNEKIRPRDVKKSYRYMEGTIMFPSSHDITKNNFIACYLVLKKLLIAGNRVLVVSKPHLSCISLICDDLKHYRHNILFRFTITACDDSLLSFWEPGAPAYQERKDALQYAYKSGYETSVSVEPMLDSENIEALVSDLSPLVTNSIWIGKMNDIRRRVEITDKKIEQEVRKIEEGQTDERIKEIYEKLRGNPLVRWKESIKKVIGLELPSEPGLDV